MTTSKTETAKTAKTADITKLNVRVNLKTDFSETLEVTRTLFKDKVSKTSIVEASLACAAASSESFTCTQIAKFVTKNLAVDDCFHKREANKQNDVFRSTVLRVRHHVVDTLKTHSKADQLYSFDKKTDAVVFTDAYRALCQKDLPYRKRVSALIAKVKAQYNAPAAKPKTKKTKKAAAKPAETKAVVATEEKAAVNA